MINLHIEIEGTFPNGILVWVVCGDRVTRNYWSDINACTAEVTSGLVSITVYERGTFSNVGTMVINIIDSDGTTSKSITRRLKRQPNTMGKPLVPVTCTVDGPYALEKYILESPPPSCVNQQTEVSWPVDVCVGHGSPCLRPVTLTEDGCKTLATRWSSYVQFALLIGSTAETEMNRYTTLAVALGCIGGCYHMEDEDDRGIAELTLCRADDCDGMAMSSVFFWNLVVHNYKVVRAHVRNPDTLAMLDWAVRCYPTAFVVFGSSKNPDPPHKQFYHAWAACEARPASMYRSFDALSAAERTALKQLDMTEEAWCAGENFSCRKLKWAQLSPAQCTALKLLGWNSDMWAVKPKLHVECTSALSFETAGTTPTEQVTKLHATYRKDPLFDKKKRKLLFSGIRRTSDKIDFYINCDALYGANFTLIMDDPVKYTDWLNSDDMYSREKVACCDAACSDQRTSLAPVILRSREETSNLARPSDNVGKMPEKLSRGSKYVVTDWNPAMPPQANQTWSPQPIVLDLCTSWVMWTPLEVQFEDGAMPSCAMCSKN